MRKLTHGRWSRAFYFRLSALFSVNPFTIWETGKAIIILKTTSTGWKLEKHPIHFTELDIAKDNSPQIIEYWTIGECFVECMKSMTTSKLRVFYSKFQFLAAL